MKNPVVLSRQQEDMAAQACQTLYDAIRELDTAQLRLTPSVSFAIGTLIGSWVVTNPNDRHEPITGAWLLTMGFELQKRYRDGSETEEEQYCLYDDEGSRTLLSLIDTGGGVWSGYLGDVESDGWPHDLRARLQVIRLIQAIIV